MIVVGRVHMVLELSAICMAEVQVSPGRWLAGGGGLHWHRHGFSTRQTGHTLLRSPPPPHRFLRLPPPTNFCKWNSSSSVVVGVSGAVQQENCLQEGGKHVACGLRRKVCSATLAGGGRTSSTKQEWVSSTPPCGAADPRSCAQYCCHYMGHGIIYSAARFIFFIE